MLLIITLLVQSNFFGEISYYERDELKKRNSLLQTKNNQLIEQNKILEFEIQNSQDSSDHVESFAREKLNLSYPEEEFIFFKKEKIEDDEKE